jgi:outer membrane protein assembly factor BamE (lipoprotein component of BamABCDE complex)
MTRRGALVFAFFGLMLAAGCSAIYRDHGYIPTDQDLEQIVVGKTTRTEVAELVGRPSAAGLMEGSGWYYVGSRWRHYGARSPEEIERQVVAVSFTPAGVVQNVERFGLERGQVVVLSRRVTATNIRSVSFVRQILGNLGRLDAGQLLD